MKSTLIQLFSFILFIVFISSCESKQTKERQTISKQIKKPTFPILPKSMTFCGEKIDLTDIDIRERLDKEILTIAYFQSATTGAFQRSTRFFPIFERILKEEGIHSDIKYLAVIESNLVQASSPAGAQGLWQFMETAGKMYSLEINSEVDERMHVEKSTRAACLYLKDNYAVLNDWISTCASYNRGLGGVQSDMEWQGTKHYFDTEQNSETGRYVYRILAAKLIFENPEAYGYFPKDLEMYQTIKTIKVSVCESIPNLAVWVKEKGFNLKILRKLNPWLISTRLTITPGKCYEIQLPTKSEKLGNY